MNIVAKIDKNLLQRVEGSEIISKLQSMSVLFEAAEQCVLYSITFYQKDETGKEQMEGEAIVVVPVDDFLSRVYNQIYGNVRADDDSKGTLCGKCSEWKRLAGVSDLTLIVYNLDDHYRKQTTKVRQEFHGKITGNVPGKMKKRKMTGNSEASQVSRIDVESALLSAQLEQEVNARLVSDPSKVADVIGQITKSIAERQNKLSKAWNFNWFVEGCNNNCVKVDKSGVGLLHLWQQQLRQFNHVGVETAQAIAKAYPSPQNLIQAYRTLPREEASKLLANIPVRRGVGVLANSRNVGIELSKKIHKYFTENEATASL